MLIEEASFPNYNSLNFIYVMVSFRILKSEIWYRINYRLREVTCIYFSVTRLKENFKSPKYVIFKWLQFFSNRWRQTTERQWCEEENGWGSYRGCRHDEYSFVWYCDIYLFCLLLAWVDIKLLLYTNVLMEYYGIYLFTERGFPIWIWLKSVIYRVEQIFIYISFRIIWHYMGKSWNILKVFLTFYKHKINIHGKLLHIFLHILLVNFLLK